MKVILHRPQRKEIEIPGGRKLIEIARELNINLESHLVVRNNTILTRDEFIRDDEVIEVFPAVSGG
ncbi:sulfur carrier protein [Thermanaeromonas toyohensis ToBE]|uniref:Sulfur carrier protein n=1 Tax=Thermanaeromonas toyohensis ToBE TaxID=698762 RepID=A0A1W1VXK1_9FIRM|nr:MoaD/ThiS family protein [Thermanaeromonas toyohensis]SMB98112.1 sulfur carrier protein [Thermanaeromonas toyohensis ToBE]